MSYHLVMTRWTYGHGFTFEKAKHNCLKAGGEIEKYGHYEFEWEREPENFWINSLMGSVQWTDVCVDGKPLARPVERDHMKE